MRYVPPKRFSAKGLDIMCPGGYNVSMGVTEVKAWVCGSCGYVWLKVSSRKPLRCPGCRTRRWNESVENTGSAAGGSEVRRPVHRTSPAGRSPKPAVWVGNERSVAAVEHGPEPESVGDAEAVASKLCRNPDCGRSLEAKNGFWFCPDLTGCSMGGQQQGRV